MKIHRTFLAALGSVGIACASLSAPARGEGPAGQPEGLEILARGPVHEAYANPATSKPVPSPNLPAAPPKAIEEVPPDQKPPGENVQWIPGYWSWDEEKNDYIWVSGFWRQPPPGRRWIPGSWRQTDGAWQWVPGLWAAEQKNDMNYLPAPPDPLDSGPAVADAEVIAKPVAAISGSGEERAEQAARRDDVAGRVAPAPAAEQERVADAERGEKHVPNGSGEVKKSLSGLSKSWRM